jgi:hypothetical protein
VKATQQQAAQGGTAGRPSRGAANRGQPMAAHGQEALASAFGERPWVVTGQQARLLVGGVKTEHRWPVAVPADMQPPDGRCWVQDIGDGRVPTWTVFRRSPTVRRWSAQVTCPLGSPGTWVWLQEAWRVVQGSRGRQLLQWRAEDDGALATSGGAWQRPEQQPREYTRLVLRTVAVEIRRLQSLTLAEARSEGFGSVSLYREHWERRHAACQRWGDDPWVWVVVLQPVWQRFPDGVKPVRPVEGLQGELELV